MRLAEGSLLEKQITLPYKHLSKIKFDKWENCKIGNTLKYRGMWFLSQMHLKSLLKTGANWVLISFAYIKYLAELSSSKASVPSLQLQFALLQVNPKPTLQKCRMHTFIRWYFMFANQHVDSARSDVIYYCLQTSERSKNQRSDINWWR